ncbi:hypothetical protein OUY24_39160 [Nonomuraea ferruginea]|uniref:NAD-dependent epimerase/dehydratase family protein n=2 Tax=Nonomuraea TaxID=83681 RepID=A0ABT4TC31_9ACTN|nr:hypothetical protein [Nonomuraea ferruginea]MDA0646683.1 hypothetical protein [Nonomuraea ferruginea]
MLLLLENERSIGGTFNLGSSEETSILDLGRRVIELAGSDSEIVFVPHEEVYGPHSEEPLQRVPDTGRLRSLTGWRSTHSLDDVLRDVIAEVRAEG